MGIQVSLAYVLIGRCRSAMIHQMITKVFQQWILPPVFPDKEQTRAARWLNFLILFLTTLILADSVGILVGILDQDKNQTILLSNLFALITNLVILFIMRHGYVKVATIIMLSIFYILITYLNAIVFQSVRTFNVIAYFVLIPLVGLLLGRRSMNIFAALCIVTIGSIFYFEWAEILVAPSNSRSIFDDLIILFFAIGLNTVLLNASILRVEEKAEEIRKTAAVLTITNIELQKSQAELWQARHELEEKVQQRTRELQESNHKLQREVEERQRLLDALAASEANWRSFAEQVPDVIARINSDYMIAFINRESGGYEPESLTGVPAIKLYPQPQHQSLLYETMKTVFETGEAISYEIEENIDEHRTWHINRIGPIYQDSKVVALILISTDITEQKQAEAAMYQMQKLESLGVLAGGVAHDFNNLLAVMLMQLSLALTKLPPDHPVNQHIQRTIKAAERATEVTRQMLNYAGRTQSEIKLLDINELITDNIHLFSASVHKNITLISDLSKKIPMMKGDKGQTQQLIMNLIINSADAIGTNTGEIRVITKSQFLTAEEAEQGRWVGAPPLAGQYVRLEVHDTGCGMDAQTLTKIFDPFFTTKFTGRGLGLASVIGIVRSHKGALHVASTLGKGTIFTVLFPATIEVSLTADQTAEQPLVGHGELVLVIDDEEMVRDSMTEILSSANLHVLAAADGQTGLQLLREYQHEVRLILLDLAMPGMSGEETFHKILEIDPYIPVILVSGYSEADVMTRFMDRGLAGFVQKPYSAEWLLQQIRTHLKTTTNRQNQRVASV